MEDDMPNDHDVQLLQDVIEQYRLSPKAIARHCNLHINSVYSYLSGVRNIPAQIWSTLFEITADVRIPLLNTGRRAVTILAIGNIPDLTDNEISLRASIESMAKFCQLQKLLVDIVADGKVNKDDATVVKQYRRHFPEFISHAHAIHAAVVTAYEKACTETKR